MAQKIVLITDYTGYFWNNHVGTKENHIISQVDVSKIKRYLENMDFEVTVCTFSDIPEGIEWQNTYVLYASSDKRGGFYKAYIEDIVYDLKMKGATLIPEFKYLKAHENKNYAELLRKNFHNERLRYPESKIFGCFQELDENACKNLQYPCVVKMSSGSGSGGVFLVNDKSELLKIAQTISTHIYYDYKYTKFRRLFEFGLGYQVKKIYHAFRGVKGHYKLEKDHSNKFLIQSFIPGLKGDYKVLYFGDKYYLLYRENRDNDFRASGSGKFVFPDLNAESRKILDFAKDCVEEMETPMLSMDIAITDENCYLIEYQAICFGPYTLEFSEFYFKYDNDQKEWTRINETPDLEREISNSVKFYRDNMKK